MIIFCAYVGEHVYVCLRGAIIYTHMLYICNLLHILYIYIYIYIERERMVLYVFMECDYIHIYNIYIYIFVQLEPIMYGYATIYTMPTMICI